MTGDRNLYRRSWCALCLLMVAAAAHAAQPLCSIQGLLPTQADRPTHDLFAAIESGALEARYIASSANSGRLLLRNTTGEPFNIRLPEHFAAVPVLAQFDFDSIFDPDSQQKQPQPVGGPFSNIGNPLNSGSGNGNQGAGQAPPFNFFNQNCIEPERVAQIRVTTVCLDHGAPDPRASMPYRLVPLETVNSDPRLADVLASFGAGECDQEVTQAAAWHVTDGMSFKQLGQLKGERRVTQPRAPLFSRQQLRKAEKLVEEAAEKEKGRGPADGVVLSVEEPVSQGAVRAGKPSAAVKAALQGAAR